MKVLSTVSLFIAVLLLGGCKKGGSSGSTDVAPTNLTLEATVSNDNSGNVALTATATNAVTYDFDFGNGVFQTVPSGKLTYKYPATGSYIVSVTAKSAGGKTVSKSITINVTVALTLVWSEEFDTAGAPDASKWGYDLGTGSGGWGNNEQQYYTNRTENVNISNGTLKITARKESFSGSAYTSTRMLTKDKFSVKYGKIEASIKIPAGGGTWPAFWMLGNNIASAGWPACGEIDIMEHVGNSLNKIYGTVHHPGHSGGNADGGTVMNPTATTAFHKYTVEWTATTIRFLVDDVSFYSFGNQASLPFNQNFFIILNVAMGGNFGGAIDPAFTSATMEVDYVRVYQ